MFYGERVVILIVVLIVASLTVGAAVGWASFRLPRFDPASPRAAKPAARAIEHALDHDDRFRRFLRTRVDPRVATGLLLTVVLALVVLFGVLVFQVRADAGIVRFDRTVEHWADGHAADLSHDVIGTVTDLGGDRVVIVTGLVVALFVSVRSRSARAVPFLIVVIVGQSLMTTLIKEVVGRGRPDIGVLRGLDPSFPSGHTATAAATFAACALLLGRGRSRPMQAVLTGVAVAVAIAVAASRVMLGVHWFSDVVAGLALGWAWFAVAALAFGGRLLHFGAPVEAAERHRRLVDTAS